MQKQTYQIEINAPASAIWDAIINPKKYRIWTYAFNKDSHFDGSWNKGDKIHFIGRDEETGEMHGMVSQIEESDLHQFVSIKHLGVLNNGKEDFESEMAKSWSPAYENYTFSPTESGATLFKAEVDLQEEYAEMFEEMWANGLKLLKLIAESFFETEVVVNSPIDKVWDSFTNPIHIINWNAASPDWECPKATNQLQVEGKFSYAMAAKDGSVSFDFNGLYFDIIPNSRIAYKMEDDRIVYIYFEAISDNETKVTQLVQKENENPMEMQKAGWQSISNNFKAYTEENL